MNYNNIVYIDCNRNNARKKSDTVKNEWTTQFEDGLYIPKGTRIEIPQAQINYQGLQGGSIEILEEVDVSMNCFFYISDSDFSQPYEVPQVDPDARYDGLDVLYDTAYTVNIPHKRMSVVAFDILLEPEIYQEGYYGYTEAPMFACYIDQYGYLAPVMRTVNFSIPPGIYGISQMSQLIQDQLNGVRNLEQGEKSLFQINSENGQQDNFIQSNLVLEAQAFPYRTNIAYGTYTNWTDVLTYATPAEAFQITYTQRQYIYIDNGQFTNLINNAFKTSGNNQSSNLYYTNFLAQQLVGAVQNQRDNDGYYMSGGVPIHDPANVPTDELLKYSYRPLAKAYYLGTSDFQLVWDAQNSGFSIKFLHSPRRIPTYDKFGDVLSDAGKICSFIREPISQIDVDCGGLTPEMTQRVKSSLSAPLSRNSGVCIYCADLTAALKYSDKDLTGKDKQKFYYLWNDFFTSVEKAKTAWENTIWSRLGFGYDQFNNPEYFEDVNMLDQDLGEVYGITTNNQIDISVQNTIATLYCPLQETGTKNPVNWNQQITNQVKMYDIQPINQSAYPLVAANNKVFSYSLYLACILYPVITDSKPIIAYGLPKLSQFGYFIISSDIIDSQTDILKENQNLPLLAIIPKTNLSSQDFITGSSPVYHITSNDKIINSITIKILHPDLTPPPGLGDGSSVLIQLTLPYPAIEAPQETKKARSKKT